MSSEETGTFNVSLRVLGNEFVGFSVAADSFSTKWVIIGTMVMTSMAACVAAFGPDIVALFQ